MSYPVVHFDLGCQDSRKSLAFFEQVFGWQSCPNNAFSHAFDTGWDHGIAGMTTALGHEPHHYCMVYIQVGDIPAMLKRITDHGGDIVIGETEAPDQGWFAWAKDPHDNLIGLWKPLAKPTPAADNMPEIFNRLAQSCGLWHGSKRVVDDGGAFDFTSDLQLRLQPIADTSFWRFDYRWMYQQKPIRGVLRVGYDAAVKKPTGDWLDGWHMSSSIMTLTSESDAQNRILLTGSYAAPPGPDWGWQIDVTPPEDDIWKIRMFNVTPDGDASEAVIMTLKALQ